MQLIHNVSGLLQQFPQPADGVLSAVHAALQRPQRGGQTIPGGPGLPAGGLQLLSIHRGQHQLRRGRSEFLRGCLRVSQAGIDGGQFGPERFGGGLGRLRAGQCRKGVLHLRSGLLCGCDGIIQFIQRCLQILPGFSVSQMFQDVVHLCLRSRKLLGRLQSLIGGGQIRLPAGAGIRQRLGQLRAGLPKCLTGGQQIPGCGLQAYQGVRIVRAGPDHLGKRVADFPQTARQSPAGGLKCRQLFLYHIPLRRPLELALRLLQDLVHPRKAAGNV